jgi:hypothetical protein
VLRMKGILCQAMHEDKTCGATLLPVAAVAIPLLHGSADKEEQTRGRALSLLHSMEVSKDKCVECALTSVVRMIVQQDLCMCPVVASVPSGCHERKDGKVRSSFAGFARGREVWPDVLKVIGERACALQVDIAVQYSTGQLSMAAVAIGSTRIRSARAMDGSVVPSDTDLNATLPESPFITSLVWACRFKSTQAKWNVSLRILAQS